MATAVHPAGHREALIVGHWLLNGSFCPQSEVIKGSTTSVGCLAFAGRMAPSLMACMLWLYCSSHTFMFSGMLS